MVIVDEIHEMGEPERGPRLESLLVSLFQRIAHVQVIGLSATIGAPQELAAWLSTLGTPIQLIYSETLPRSQSIPARVIAGGKLKRQLSAGNIP